MKDFGIKDVLCLSCQQGYNNGFHTCDDPDYCPCDRDVMHANQSLQELLTRAAESDTVRRTWKRRS